MSKIRKYNDFTLELDSYNDSTGFYQVRMSPTTTWGAPSPVSVNLNLSEMILPLRDLQAKDIYIEDLILLGRKLADRLLPAGTIRNSFVEAVQDAALEKGIRLRLLIRDIKLAQIPWEYTYLPLRENAQDDHSNFLVMNPRVSLVRNPPMEGRVRRLSRSKLLLMGVMANPNAPGLRKLDLKAERGFIEKSLRDIHVDGPQIEWKPFLEDVTEGDLDTVLLKKPDIFHFSGHGVFSERAEQGSVLLVENKESLKPFYLEAKSFARKLASASVRMAYLGACETSKLQDASAWTGVAQALIAEGVLAVLAMQYEVQDTKAILFANAFYRNLASGFSLDEAVYKGRLAVLEKSGDKGIEWGVPTLYLRAQDGLLFKGLGGLDVDKSRKEILKKQIVDEFSDAITLALQRGEIQKIRIGVKTKIAQMNITIGPFT